MKNTVLVTLSLRFVVMAPAVANIDPPWGFPKCSTEKSAAWVFPKPYVPMREQYSGIYKAIESAIAPGAAMYFPDLKFEEHRNWVRVSRDTRQGNIGKKFFLGGSWHTVTKLPPGNNRMRRLSMRIDKCDGTISEVKWEN